MTPIKDCRYSSDLTPQELWKILSAPQISHNNPCLHVKSQDGEDPAVYECLIVDSFEPTSSS